VKFTLLSFFLIVASVLPAQYKISGKVIDEKNKSALAFVNIVANNSNQGTTTDIDGKFSLESKTPIQKIKLSYVGYQPKELSVAQQTYIIVKLTPTSYQLAEFKVRPGINPAERIVRKAVENRKIHNPEKSLNFKYDTYNKIYFTGAIDSAILNNPDTIVKLDSSNTNSILFILQSYHYSLR